MKRILQTILTLVSSRALPPVVIGFFFIIYIGIAFFTDETLITLMAFTRNSLFLAAILALIPTNSMLRILQETGRYFVMRRILVGKSTGLATDLYDETVTLPFDPFNSSLTPLTDSRSLVFEVTDLEGRLASAGYKTIRSEKALSAWRGFSAYPARLFFLFGTFCLFSGILISITSRTSQRQMVIEGTPLSTPSGIGGTVERITLANTTGPILTRTLTMEVAPSNSGYGKRTFGIYPPSLYAGSFVYFRYLGIALHLRFSAPDLQPGYETYCNLNCYPPGKEDSESIPGSPYRIVFSLTEPDAGSDRYISYMTGNATLRFKLMKGKELVLTGSAPAGGEFSGNGYRLAFPDIRRLVVTDFIRDYGVLFIWAAALFFAAAIAVWIPVRVFFPRREMQFRFDQGVATACSYAEGGARKHAGVFNELLDMINAKRVVG